jgi:hypothetical protein
VAFSGNGEARPEREGLQFRAQQPDDSLSAMISTDPQNAAYRAAPDG